MKKYLKVWYLTTVNAVSVDLSKRFSAFLLIIGKSIRISLFGFFLALLFSGNSKISGYSLGEAAIFYLTFNLIDSLSQFFLRGTYNFRDLVVKGNLDFYLARPLNVLFSVLTAHTDILDFIMLGPIILTLGYFVFQLPGLTLFSLVVYSILLLNGLLLATAFHLIAVSLAIVTYEVDNVIMIYRDLTALARIPVDFYREPVRFLITFVLPIGLMITFPAKFLLGALSLPMILLSLAISWSFFFLSLRVWEKALKLYSSASS